MSRHKRITPLPEAPTPAREGSVAAGYAVLLFLAALVSVAAWAVTA